MVLPKVKPLYLTLGILSLALGVAGIFLPLLPTTPFLLLSAVLFSRSSERLHRWLVEHPRLGPPIRDWREHGVVGTGAKVTATFLMAISWLTTVFVVKAPRAGIVAMSLFFVCVLAFLWTRPSRPRGT